jgi:hypothetical protein
MKPILIGVFALLSLHVPAQRVCSIKSSATDGDKLSDKYTLYSTSGNLFIDQQTLAELNFLASRFLVIPNFFFYDDNDGVNAKASDEVTNQYRPDGTIVFGKRLFNRQTIKPNGSTAIPIIIAHEFAHIADFKYGILSHVTKKKKELFADYMAGIYMDIRIRYYGFVDIGATRATFAGMGDTEFGNKDSHGTAEERTRALMAGYNLAGNYFRRGTQHLLNLETCLQAAKDYVDENVEEDEDDAMDPEDGSFIHLIEDKCILAQNGTVIERMSDPESFLSIVVENGILYRRKKSVSSWLS